MLTPPKAVKPISLMRWLVRLVCPPGGVCLDPFAGSGSTGCAAALEGFAFIGIEMSPEYAAIAEKRIAFWQANGDRPVNAAGVKTGVYGGGKGLGYTVPRCPEHNESLPSGWNTYRCGCKLVKLKERPAPAVLQAVLPLEGAAD